MAEAMLLGGGLDFVRFSGDTANSASYSGRIMRGPTGLRPPPIARSWDLVAPTAGAARVPRISRAASISTVVVDLSVVVPSTDDGKCDCRADSPEQAADFLEYLFATTGLLAALRTADGHPAPYAAKGIIFEVSNECKAVDSYFSGALNGTIAAMVGRAVKVAPAVVPHLEFGSMGGETSDVRANARHDEVALHWADVVRGLGHQFGAFVSRVSRPCATTPRRAAVYAWCPLVRNADWCLRSDITADFHL